MSNAMSDAWHIVASNIATTVAILVATNITML